MPRLAADESSVNHCRAGATPFRRRKNRSHALHIAPGPGPDLGPHAVPDGLAVRGRDGVRRGSSRTRAHAEDFGESSESGEPDICARFHHRVGTARAHQARGCEPESERER